MGEGFIKYGCTVAGDFFCPRPMLERELASRIESGQNVVIQSNHLARQRKK